MTKKLPDPLLQVPPFIPRKHFACRLRNDLAEIVRQRCKELNCSQGVFLEVLISKGLLANLITEKDVYDYSHSDRWLHRVLSDIANTTGTVQYDDALRRRAHSMLAKILPGQKP